VSPDRLGEQLREIRAPGATAARERAVAAARAEITGRDAPVRARASRRRRPASLVAAAVLIAFALVSPPGRAAAGWIEGLVAGITGEGRGGVEVTTRPVVIDKGRSPDGTRYAWVAFGCRVDLHGEGVPIRFRGFSLALHWQDGRRKVRSLGCEGHGKPAVKTVIRPGLLRVVPSRGPDVAQPDLYVSGTTGPAARRLRAVYTEPSGQQHELPVDFARVEGRLRKRAGVRRPLGTYVVFVPGARAAREGLADCVGAYALVPGSPQGRPRRRCTERPDGASPIELIAYDGQGHELQRIGVPLSAADLRALRPDVPSEAQRRRFLRRARRGSTVLLRGRAPDGARYELTVKLQRERSGKVYGICTDLWWPRGPSGGFCGPELPPSGAFGHRHPERVAAKGFGFLGDERPATSRLTLSGYARSWVRRVRVVYEARSGERRDAPVKLVRVHGPLRRRVGASEPFGFWMAFLPRSVAGAKGAHGREAIEVIAYGDRGQELSRVEQVTSPVNGLVRVPRRR
jgi:hypothetical protein